jgi:3-methyladenine DNA glycosylase/8-oxoguanine DNA glycosylase
MPGLRITRTGAVFEAMVPTILAQKVVGKESARSYRALVQAWGEPAPGPTGLRLPPSAESLATRPYHDFHPFGIEMRRAGAIRMAASSVRRMEQALDLGAEEARRLLSAFPGVGPWSAAEVAIVALGDADAVSVGDYHLPHTVSWALTGRPRGSDQRMLELLEPYHGHRGRVLRLLEAAGIAAPRSGPRMPVRSIARL